MWSLQLVTSYIWQFSSAVRWRRLYLQVVGFLDNPISFLGFQVCAHHSVILDLLKAPCSQVAIIDSVPWFSMRCQCSSALWDIWSLQLITSYGWQLSWLQFLCVSALEENTSPGCWVSWYFDFCFRIPDLHSPLCDPCPPQGSRFSGSNHCLCPDSLQDIRAVLLYRTFDLFSP